MARARVLAASLAIGLLIAHSWRLETRLRELEARPCIVASAAPELPRTNAAPETPAARSARLERQARELVAWEAEYDFLMRRARIAAQDRETLPR